MLSATRLVASLTVSLALVTFGCGKSSFSSKNFAKKDDKSTATANPSETDKAGKSDSQKQSGPNDNKPSSENSTPKAADPYGGKPPTPEDLDPCTGQKQLGKALIIDLKSGWLAGDGGRFFKERLDPKCPGAGVLAVDYYHITTAIVESNKDLRNLTPNDALACTARLMQDAEGRLEGDANPEKVCSFNSFSQYSQIWILSGDEYDPIDIRIASSLFRSLLSRLDERTKSAAQTPVGLFIGAGLSNISHANAAAGKILSSDVALFTRNAQVATGVFPSQRYVSQFDHAPLKASAELNPTAGTFAEKFAVFNSLESIFDYGKINLFGLGEAVQAQIQGRGNSIFTQVPSCFADPISNPAFTVVARDSCNQGAIAFLDRPGLRILAEGNMARFYGLADPQEYMTRIARFLSLPQK
jgi:hypothetical protein